MMKAEISYDLLMNDDMAFVEGTLRLSGDRWQVFIFSRFPVEKAEITLALWGSGVSGISVRFPVSQKLNKTVVEQVLSEALGVTEWIEVRGPDSMQLR